MACVVLINRAPNIRCCFCCHFYPPLEHFFFLDYITEIKILSIGLYNILCKTLYNRIISSFYIVALYRRLYNNFISAFYITVSYRRIIYSVYISALYPQKALDKTIKMCIRKIVLYQTVYVPNYFKNSFISNYHI